MALGPNFPSSILSKLEEKKMSQNSSNYIITVLRSVGEVLVQQKIIQHKVSHWICVVANDEIYRVPFRVPFQVLMLIFIHFLHRTNTNLLIHQQNYEQYCAVLFIVIFMINIHRSHTILFSIKTQAINLN